MKMSEAATIRAMCKHCAMWQMAEIKGPVEIGAKKRGTCIMVPPTPFPKYNNMGEPVAQFHLRPTPKEDEVCGMFTPHPDVLAAANGGTSVSA
jgi:hypothetical protein